jgi:hypothetical protein
MTLHSSPIGHGGHRDDRRRRLLAEDHSANSEASGQDLAMLAVRSGQSHVHKSVNYGDAEFLQTQLRLTDLVPRRLIVHFFLFVAGMTVVGGLMAIYVWTPILLRNIQTRPTVADLGHYGSLGSWFASLSLLLASLMAIVTYSIRRHRIDDYHGHYHVWLWAAGCWFAMATDQAASVHQAAVEFMVSLTGARMVGDGSIWWLVPAVLLVGAVGSRLLVDMWSSRLSSWALIIAGAAYAASFVAFFHGIRLQSDVVQLLLVQGLWLGGHLLLALSMGLHARHVLLDAEGALPKRIAKKKAGKKRKEKKTDAANEVRPEDAGEVSATDNQATPDESDLREQGSDYEKPDDQWIAVDPPHGGLQPVLKRVSSAEIPAAPAAAQQLNHAEAAASSSDIESSKLNKADRKAMKKKLLDERLKREQRKAANW